MSSQFEWRVFCEGGEIQLYIPLLIQLSRLILLWRKCSRKHDNIFDPQTVLNGAFEGTYPSTRRNLFDKYAFQGMCAQLAPKVVHCRLGFSCNFRSECRLSRVYCLQNLVCVSILFRFIDIHCDTMPTCSPCLRSIFPSAFVEANSQRIPIAYFRCFDVGDFGDMDVTLEARL